MNNKKLSRLLEPNLKLYFIFLAIFAVSAFMVNPSLGLIQGAVTGMLYFYARRLNQKR